MPPIHFAISGAEFGAVWVLPAGGVLVMAMWDAEPSSRVGLSIPKLAAFTAAIVVLAVLVTMVRPEERFVLVTLVLVLTYLAGRLRTAATPVLALVVTVALLAAEISQRGAGIVELVAAVVTWVLAAGAAHLGLRASD